MFNLSPSVQFLIIPLLLALSAACGYLLAGPLVRSAFSGHLERLVIWALLGAIAFSWVGSTLAAMGIFRWWIVLAVLLAMVALVRWLFRAPAPLQPRPAYSPLPDIIALGLLIATIWLYARPAESFFLSDDSAVYTISGVALARTGSLFLPVEGLGAQDDATHTFFTVSPWGVITRHFGPFYQWGNGNKPIEIGFMPIAKVWPALTVWLFGPAQAPWAAPFFGVLSILVQFFFLRRLLGWPAALLGVAVLGVSFPQVWFARYPISEIYMQAILIGGLYLALLARQHKENRRLAQLLTSWSALAISALAILRLESPLLLPIIVTLFVLTWQPGKWQQGDDTRRWLLTMVIAGAYGLVVAICVTRHYLLDHSMGLMSPSTVQKLVPLLLITIAAGWALYKGWQSDARVKGFVQAVLKRLPLIIGIGWIMWSLLAVWWLTTRPWGNTLPGWIVLYWSRPGMAVSVAGILLFLWQQQRRMTSPELVVLLGLSVALLLVYSAKPLVTPVQPWAMRRMVPTVLPSLAIGGAALLAEGLALLRRLAGSSPSPKLAASVSFGLLGLALVGQGVLIGQHTESFLLHREAEGFYTQLEAFAQSFPEGAVLFFDNGSVGQRLPQAMELVFERTSLSVRKLTTHDTQDVLDMLIGSAKADGRRVFLIATDGRFTGWPEGWELTPQRFQVIDTPVLRTNEDRAPNAQDLVNRRLSLDIYEIVPREGTPELTEALDVPLGPGSYPYLQSGFSWCEQDAAGDYMRWTTGDGLVAIPWPATAPHAPASFCLTLQVTGGRPDDHQPAQLVVEAEGVEVARQELPDGFTQGRIQVNVQELHNQGDPALEIQLHSNTWSPDGQRQLGVLLSDLQIAPADQCPDG
ncbi:MAG: hypothetical protein GX552_00380 [Chloroflexi bacterium]|jgi:hypothetical protein|nr:hypothetical protein [Chloroflexota bacterium]